jgi:hypothetical protein
MPAFRLVTVIGQKAVYATRGGGRFALLSTGREEQMGGGRRLMRSRWAAIGAAVAVALGGGGAFLASAAPSSPSSVITVDPVRILDTRNGIGAHGQFQSPNPRKLQVVGTAVPAGATGVLMNVTVVGPTAAGFLSVRPGNATGAPQTSSLNFPAGATVANSVQVALPTSGPNAGQVDITYDALGVVGPVTHVLADVVGYVAPNAPLNLRWAKIGLSAQGAQLLNGSGVVSAKRIAAGTVRVGLTSSIVECAWTATINDNDRGGAVPGEITVERGDLETELLVMTWPSTGGPPADLAPEVGANDGFSLMVVCP